MSTQAQDAAGGHGHAHGSLYGQDFLEFMDEIGAALGPAWRTAEHVMTHGDRYPVALAALSLGLVDQAAYEVLKEHPAVLVEPQPPQPLQGTWWDMAVNSMGRLHLRPGGQPRVLAHEDDRWFDIGIVRTDAALENRIAERVAQLRANEAAALQRLRSALQACDAQGRLPEVVEQVIDHVEHVESVCFYSEDRVFALIDRFTNLTDTKAGPGFLPRLRGLPLAQWTDQQLLIGGALHALFTSGRAVRFEEFNGCTLTAARLLDRLTELHGSYVQAGCEPAVDASPDTDAFALAEDVRRMATSFTGRTPLRYRWIYALTFQKHERMLANTQSSEDPSAHIAEFADLYDELLGGRADPVLPQSLVFTQLASACLARDLCGQGFEAPGSAATSWIEHLIERIVASAVRATASDYGMSSSLRDIGRLRLHDCTRLAAEINSLVQADFYTCFVSDRFGARLDAPAATLIASSVQKRMMFNRWHFIPGNIERGQIAPSRHWYYPPLVPDIAIHSDVHRAAHSRARVKFSIRAPGPDMSRPALRIAEHQYRGFYDIRVVRMDGQPYDTEDMVRARRRTLWLEAVYGVLVSHLEESPSNRLRIEGFGVGRWLDLGTEDAAAVEAETRAMAV